MKVTLKMLSLAACVFSGCFVFHAQGMNPQASLPTCEMEDTDYATVSVGWDADSDFSEKAPEFESNIKSLDNVVDVANTFNSTFGNSEPDKGKKAYAAVKAIAYMRMIPILINTYVKDVAFASKNAPDQNISDYIIEKLKIDLNDIENFKLDDDINLDDLLTSLSSEIVTHTCRFIEEVDGIVASLWTIINSVKAAEGNSQAQALLKKAKIEGEYFTIESLLRYIVSNINKKEVQESAPQVLCTILTCVIQQINSVNGLAEALQLDFSGMNTQINTKIGLDGFAANNVDIQIDEFIQI